MFLYDYEQINVRINVIDQQIKHFFLQNTQEFSAENTGQLRLADSNTEMQNLQDMVNQAAEEIKQYVEQILNDNGTREKVLEKLQDELNENIRFIGGEKEKLKTFREIYSSLLGRREALDQFFQTAINKLNDIEQELNKVYEVYREVQKKGWKIIFYPALGIKALQYATSNKDEVLEQQRNIQRTELDKLRAEDEGLLERECELEQEIHSSTETIAKAETTLIMQKEELGKLKYELVKWTNAYIYYSMLRQKICETDSRLQFQTDFCENIEVTVLTQKELEELLELWEKNKSDSETVYRILREMFEASRTACVGKDMGDMFDDSSYIRNRFEKIRGIHIQSGYILDGIQVLYAADLKNQFCGGKGGSEHIIEFDPGDELKSIEGHYNVPYIIPSGDAIGELYIITKKGKRYGPYGGSMGRGTSFKLELPQDTHFVGFYGKSSESSFITQLGLLYAKTM